MFSIAKNIFTIAGVLALIALVSGWNIPKADISQELTEGLYLAPVDILSAEEEKPAPEPPARPQSEVAPPPTASSVCEVLSAEDQELLARVAYLEAPSQGWEGLAVIVNVILNRANLYGASVHDIVYSPGQFAVTDLIPTCTPPQDAYTAVWAVMQGWDASAGALYFCSPAHNGWHKAHLTYLFSAWGHEFYK